MQDDSVLYLQDQDKILQQQKTCREAEQERQWKQLQAMRQAQAQQQQQTIHDQRVQGSVQFVLIRLFLWYFSSMVMQFNA